MTEPAALPRRRWLAFAAAALAAALGAVAAPQAWPAGPGSIVGEGAVVVQALAPTAAPNHAG